MNTENNAVTPNLPAFTKSEEEEIMQLAAVGFMPKEIAVAMEWPREKRAAFCLLAATPGSDIAMMIAAGMGHKTKCNKDGGVVFEGNRLNMWKLHWLVG